MRLKKVNIYSNQTAKQAEGIVNTAIQNSEQSGLEINYELMIETSVQMGTFSDTRYTVVIHQFEHDERDGYYDDAGS